MPLSTPLHTRAATALALLAALVVTASAAEAQSVFVNEIHYDNAGGDQGEFVEIAGPAGTDLAGWKVSLYNGADGDTYGTINLSGTIDDEGSGYGALAFARAGIQNGPADGLALVDAGGNVIQFLSYEGSFTATDGPASGMTSTDIGVDEQTAPPVGQSLQLKGTGTSYGDFTWTEPSPESPGSVNDGQTFQGDDGGGGGTPGMIVVNTADDEDNADGDCSLREAVRAANTDAAVDGCSAGTPDGDVITFEASYTIALSMGELLVSDDVNVDGSGVGGVTVDAGGSSRIFDVDAAGGTGSDQAVAFMSLTLQNGNSGQGGSSAPDAGGAVDLKAGSTATFTDVTVSGSVAGVNGGGIHGAGGTAIVITTSDDGTSVITDNEAQGASAGMGGGGVWGAGSVTITGDVQITGNRATGAAGSGGGVFNQGGTLVVSGATISGNSANRAGGGIEDNADGDDPDTDVTLTNVTLADNFISAGNPGNGGGLHSGGGDVVVVGGSVTGNTATEGGGLWASGTLDVSGGTLIDGNEGTGDAADNGGGGVYNDGGTVTLDGVTLTSNTASGAAGSGGAILNAGGTLAVTGGLIQFNQANRAGAGIEDAGGTVTLTDVTVNANAIADAMPGNGGGLHSGGGTVTIVGGEITRNSAAEGGGLWTNASLDIQPADDGTPTLIALNTATGDDADQGGGGLYAESGATVTSDRATIGWNMATGASGSGGGVLVSDDASVTLTLGTVTWNRANRAGGGIEIGDDAATDAATTLVLDRVEVTENSIDEPAPGNGGGLHLGGAGSATVTQSTFANNGTTASMDEMDGPVGDDNAGARAGGAFWISAGGSLDLSLSTVSNNNAFGNGGGIYDDGPGGSISLSSVTVAENTAIDGGSGGGLYSQSADGASFTFENTLVGDNVAAAAGNDCFGTFTSGDYNLVEDTSGCTINGATGNNVTGQDPQLGPLADNGGPTDTRALQTGSPAIDAGMTAFVIDQRGFSRIDGTDDIGAFEFGADDTGLIACTVDAPLSFDFDGDGNGRGSDVMADDFNSAGTDATFGEFVGVRNEDAEGAPIALSTCSFVAFDPFSEVITYTLRTTGTVDPDQAYVLATMDGDQDFGQPDVLTDSPGAFALVQGTATVGADVETVLGRVVAAVVYDRDRNVFGSIGGGATDADQAAFAAALAAITSGATSTEDGPDELAVGVAPNPISGAGVVSFSLPEASDVRIALYDALGREVAVLADGTRSAGPHTAEFSASALASGVYVVRAVVGAEARTLRVTIVR